MGKPLVEYIIEFVNEDYHVEFLKAEKFNEVKTMFVGCGNGIQKTIIFKCPCGCGDSINLSLKSADEPHWLLTLDRSGRLPTLTPEVSNASKCKSRFSITEGKVVWS